MVGKGPNGEALYAAKWAREPTDAELGGYLPRNAPEGFGLVACKTMPEDRVEDCIELDQEPHGSHLASAVRQAAWQFRVRPPRKGGHALIGSWVRIRIDYYHSGRRAAIDRRLFGGAARAERRPLGLREHLLHDVARNGEADPDIAGAAFARAGAEQEPS